MAFKIGVLEADQLPTERPRSNSKVTRCIAQLLVRRALAVRINKFLIQMVVIQNAIDPSSGLAIPACVFIDGPTGVGNLVPFSKIHDPQMAPEKLHYSTPACGDHRRSWAHRFIDRQPRIIVAVETC